MTKNGLNGASAAHRMAWLRHEVNGICKKTGQPLRETAFDLAEFMLKYVMNYGGQLVYADGKPYVFDGVAKRVVEIHPRSDKFWSWITIRFGLMPTETLARMAVSVLQSQATELGNRRELRRFVYFDEETTTLYISRYDGECWRLTGDSIDVVPNGQGVLFADDDGGVPVYDPNIGNHGILLDALVNDLGYVEATEAGLTPDQQRLLLSMWIFFVAFPDLMPAKPMLLVEGEPGSGKTTAVTRIQAALHGKPAALVVGKADEADFGVVVKQHPICVLDNNDTFVEWLRDALCAYATGAGWTRRRKYTDADVVEIRPQSFIAIATANPVTFKRADVLDRCMILRLERRESFQASHALFKAVESDRRRIFGEWLYLLNEIVWEIRQHGIPAPASDQRMADVVALGNVIGRVLGFSSQAVARALQAAKAERAALTGEDDPLPDLLDRWLDARASNQGREVTTAELHPELMAIARARGIRMPKTPHGLSQRLTALMPILEQHFQAEKKRSRSQNVFVYVFRRR